MTERLGARHHEVKRLRALLRDPHARREEGAFVLEGPRVIDGALARGVPLEALYLGPGADVAFASLVAQVRASDARIAELGEGVLEKVGRTQTPQPVLGVVAAIVRPLAPVPGDGSVVVAVDVSDPGNLGTIVRSAEAAGADGVVVCGDAVDVQNPKVVRSSAGAIFGVPVMEHDDPVAALDALAIQGRRRFGTRVRDAAPYDEANLTGPHALVVGNEARGLPPEVEARLDGHVSIPMAGDAESLNVAMAATVLVFEAARQRRRAAALS